MSELLWALMGALVGGAILLWVEHRVSGSRARSKDALANALLTWLSSLQVNVNSKSHAGLSAEQRAELELVSGAEMRAAERMMIVLGPAELRQAIEDFENGPKHLSSPRTQDAVLRILRVVRAQAVPHLDPVDEGFLRSYLFAEPK